MDKKDLKTNENKIDRTQIKIDKMRMILSDQEKCKEIAQKLCAYISENTKS